MLHAAQWSRPSPAVNKEWCRRLRARTGFRFGTPLSSFAKVRAKASRHAGRNPLALLRKELFVDDVMNAPMPGPGVLTLCSHRPAPVGRSCSAAAEPSHPLATKQTYAHPFPTRRPIPWEHSFQETQDSGATSSGQSTGCGSRLYPRFCGNVMTAGPGRRRRASMAGGRAPKYQVPCPRSDG